MRFDYNFLSVRGSAGPGACHSRITSVYRRTQHWSHHVQLQWASYWNTTITALERVSAPGEDTDFIVLGDEFGALAALDASGQHLASLPPPSASTLRVMAGAYV